MNDKSELLKEITESIENFSYTQASLKKILNLIFSALEPLIKENETLIEANSKLNLDNARLKVYEKFYEDNLRRDISKIGFIVK